MDFFQARIPEWVAITFSRGPGVQPRCPQWRQILYYLSHRRSPRSPKRASQTSAMWTIQRWAGQGRGCLQEADFLCPTKPCGAALLFKGHSPVLSLLGWNVARALTVTHFLWGGLTWNWDWNICLNSKVFTYKVFIYLEKEIATHSSILAWKIPWMEELGRLQSMGSQKVTRD